MQQKIGVIGLGNMGGAVAARLIERGESLVVYDIDEDAVERLVQKGVEAATSPREVAKNVDIILTILPNGPHVEAAGDGMYGIFSGLRRDLIWLEMSTIDPEVTLRLAERAAVHDAILMDVAIGKLPHHALVGELLLMAGGDRDDLQKVEPLLAHLGEMIHCGPVGSGITMKLVNNQLAGVTFAATCESLLLGRKAGLSFEVMQQVLTRTAAANAHLEGSMAQKVIPRDFKPGFRFDLMVKDAGLALDVAQRLESPQMLSALVQQLRSSGLNHGLAEQDTSAFVQVFEEMAGIQLDEG